MLVLLFWGILPYIEFNLVWVVFFVFLVEILDFLISGRGPENPRTCGAPTSGRLFRQNGVVPGAKPTRGRRAEGAYICLLYTSPSPRDS